jgi:predicted O-methyltransferase YrrM
MDLKNATLLLEQNKKNCNWFSQYGVVSHLLKKINAKQMIEIGVAYGYHCEYILQKNETINYLGIDPYKGEYDPNDCFAEDVKKLFEKTTQQESLDLLYNVVVNKMASYNERFKLIRDNVENVDNQIEDDSVDLIYIDGDHTYNGVLKDLNFSWKKINKQHGVLCGDDYTWETVKMACENFFAEKKIRYSIITDFGAPTHWMYQFK